jgi:hypothetical protein
MTEPEALRRQLQATADFWRRCLAVETWHPTREHIEMVISTFDRAALTAAAQVRERAQPSEVERLRRDCAELYQVIGTMALHCPNTEDPAIIKALDNASDAAAGDPRRHDDLLPFVLPEPRMPIYGATEDQGPDVLGIRKGEE